MNESMTDAKTGVKYQPCVRQVGSPGNDKAFGEILCLSHLDKRLKILPLFGAWDVDLHNVIKKKK